MAKSKSKKATEEKVLPVAITPIPAEVLKEAHSDMRAYGKLAGKAKSAATAKSDAAPKLGERFVSILGPLFAALVEACLPLDAETQAAERAAFFKVHNAALCGPLEMGDTPTDRSRSVAVYRTILTNIRKVLESDAPSLLPWRESWATGKLGGNTVADGYAEYRRIEREKDGGSNAEAAKEETPDAIVARVLTGAANKLEALNALQDAISAARATLTEEATEEPQAVAA